MDPASSAGYPEALVKNLATGVSNTSEQIARMSLAGRKPEPILKVGNSYKKRKAAVDRLVLFPKLLEEIEIQRRALDEKKIWDQSSAQWRAHVRESARQRFGGTDDEWTQFATRILDKFADRFWDAGCPAPQIKNFKADVVPKEGARPSARRPFA